MSYFKGILRSLNQNNRLEEEAIQTLGNRLQHATLAADRKLAVLGLKSFSRQFRESVIQYGLRGLLSTLGKDAENGPLVKAVLETLLNLFLRTSNSTEMENELLGWISSHSRVQNGKYPSPLLMEQVELDEFSNWIADEMILTEEHVKSLMLVLQQHTGFQIRLYAIQLLEAVVAARPIRAKECILNIPLVISTIVGLLDDPNDPIRNETILLLMALVNNNFNIQKLVAFENTFQRIFEIIEEEGGIRGSILVQDCMTLLTNLLTYNASNQTFFLETDCVPKLASLIAEPIENVSPNGLQDENGIAIPAPPIVWTEQRLQNMSILLEICRSFVDPENQHLVQNQEKLFSSGIFFSILRLVFSPIMENPIRKTALQATGDIISNNAQLQLQFALIDVPYIDPSMPLQVQKYSEVIPGPVALLNWALITNSVHIFEVRLAAMHTLAKFFLGNTDAKMAFLTDQMKASKNPSYYSELKQSQIAETGEESENSGQVEETNEASGDSRKTPYANIFSVLTVFNPDVKLNPYSVWFAAITLVYLISDCPETRQVAREMKVGNAEDGEEEMTLIQAISGMLIANLENSDPRIALGYLVLLTLWMYEDFDAVDDFLSDPSTIKSIIAFLSKSSTESSEIVQGMAAILVGVCYDFSTKTSPLPRANVHELIVKGLGADSYALKVKQFKNNTIFKLFDGDLESDFEKDSSGLPNLYFTSEYVELVKDNYYRIRKSLSRGPEFEPRSRISFEIYEELETKNVELKEALKDLTQKAETNEKALKEQVEENELKLKETGEALDKCNLELKEAMEKKSEMTEKIDSLQKSIESLQAEKEKYEKSSAHYTSEFHKLSRKSASDEENAKQMKQKLAEAVAAKQKAEDGINKMSRELFQLSKKDRESEATIANLEKRISKLESQHAKAITEYQSKLEETKKANDALKAKLLHLEQNGSRLIVSSDQETSAKLQQLQGKLKDMESTNETLMEKLRSAASVVSALKADKSDLEKEKEALESELAKAYEDLEAFTHLLEEGEQPKETHEKVVEPLLGSSSSSGFDSDMKIMLEEKAKLEGLLMESKNKIVDLEKALASRNESIVQDTRNSLDTETQKSEKDEGEQHAETAQKQSSDSLDKNGALMSEVGKANKEIDSLRLELKESRESFDGDRARFEEEMASLQKEYLDLVTKHEQLESDYEQLKKEKEKEKEKEVTDDATANVNEKEHLEELEKRDAELAISAKRIKDLERNIEVLSESASTSLASFKNSQNSLKARIEELEAGKKALLEEVEELKSERVKMVDEFQEAYDDLESSYMDLELLLANVEKHKNDLEKQFHKLQEDSTSMIEKLKAEIEKLNVSLTEAKHERDGIRNEYYELEKLTNLIGSELQAKEALLQAINNKGADLAAKDKIVIEIKEKLASTIAELGDSAQKLRVLNAEKADLNKLYTECASSFESSKQTIEKLESQLQAKDKEIEEFLSENRKLSAVQQNFSEVSKANSDYAEKIQTLEKEIADLKSKLSEVNALLDDQRKLNCESSLAATLELTESSTKLEKSIVESQERHAQELANARESAEKQAQELKDRISSLKEENKSLQGKMEELQKSRSESESKSTEIDEYKHRLELLQEEIEQLKRALKDCEQRLKEKVSELEVTEKELARLSENFEKKVAESDSEVSEMRKKLSEWESQALEYEQSLKKSKTEKDAVVNDIDALKKENEKLEQEISKLDASSEDLVQISAKMKDLEARNEKSQIELLERNSEFGRQTALLEEAQRSIETLESRIKDLEAIEDQLRKIKDLEDQIERLEKQATEAKKADHNVSGIDVAPSASKEANGFVSRHLETAGSSDTPKSADEQELQKEIELLKGKIKAEQEKYESKVKQLNDDFEETKKTLEATETTMKAQHKQLTAALEDVKRIREDNQNQLDKQELEWKERSQSAEKDAKSKDLEIASLRQELNDLKQSLEDLSSSRERDNPQVNVADAKVAEAVPEEDFADLMLLCDHQEQKLAKYRRKLRALDVAISSDESDGEDLL